MAKRRARDHHLPQWAGPEWLYELMCAYRDACAEKGTLCSADMDEFAGQLGVVVQIQLATYKLDDRLRQVRGDVEAVSQDAVMHLLKQSRNGLGLRHAGWKPMMHVMNVATRNYVASAIEKAKNRFIHEAASADYYGSARDRGSPDQDGLASHDDQRADESGSMIEQLFREAEDRIIGDFVCSPGKLQLLEQLCRVVQDQIITHRCPLAFNFLPKQLKEGLYHEEHALIVSRILRAFRHGGV